MDDPPEILPNLQSGVTVIAWLRSTAAGHGTRSEKPFASNRNGLEVILLGGH